MAPPSTSRWTGTTKRTTTPDASGGPAAALLARADAPWLFVVGKGGVGKTTAAGALALASADQGTSTLVLSTDPAHSLSDLFGLDGGAAHPRPAGCDTPLTVQELDASSLVASWVARAREPLLELFDRGTYLDADDVEPFLDLSLPGIDEVAAILRLAELAEDSGYQRVVIDTAPTGHALRLLDADGVVQSWMSAFRAMERKAATVVAQLTGHTLRLAAEDFVVDLDRAVARYREGVLSRAAVVVVERPEVLVRAETDRLMVALEARGFTRRVRLRVGAAPALTDEPQEATATLAGDPRVAAATLADDPQVAAAPPADDSRVASGALMEVPLGSLPQGCEGLRGWGRPPAFPQERPEAEVDRGSGSDVSDHPALDRPLLLFVGKGGVGKTTCAAAWALEAARRGPVTLLGVDPAGSLHDVLPDPPPVDLRIRQVDADGDFEVFRDAYTEGVELAFDRSAVGRGAELDRAVVRSFLDLAPPGLDELFAISALTEELDEGRRVVVDTAPTGHLLNLVALPAMALDWVHQLMRILLKYRGTLGLDAFAERLLDFAKRLKRLNLTLTDPDRCGAVLVAQPGPLVAAESQRLLVRLEELDVPVAAMIHNREPFRPDPLRGGPNLRIRAPVVDPPPIGPESLRAFIGRWRVIP